jgi:nucleotide-binding universal stress UspA family protein
MRSSQIGVRDPRHAGRTVIGRLLFVADAAVADVHDLPVAVRAVLDAAGEVQVLTTGAHAGGVAARRSVPLVVADAVAAFEPDHILLALPARAHADGQERRLTEHIQERFRLPVTSYAVDAEGHPSTAEGPVLLCYDGSRESVHAIERAGALFAGRDAVVVTAWRAADAFGSLAWVGATEGMVPFADLDHAPADLAGHIAAEGAGIARDAGMNADPAAVEVDGRVSTVIVDVADLHDAAIIVMGSRGRAGLRSALLGSVSNAVVRRAHRPTLVVPRPEGTARTPAPARGRSNGRSPETRV